ncbi:hypothetical protein PG993_008332 [Apiospora rasikravindrae]|uniref:Uncharacterized protein n=1 Tax=Apiospora rasikravindrae TaxID=990691 RepID=A0ABR1T1H6_9PEZI
MVDPWIAVLLAIFCVVWISAIGSVIRDWYRKRYLPRRAGRKYNERTLQFQKEWEQQQRQEQQQQWQRRQEMQEPIPLPPRIYVGSRDNILIDITAVFPLDHSSDVFGHRSLTMRVIQSDVRESVGATASNIQYAEDIHSESRDIEYYRGCRDALSAGTLFKGLSLPWAFLSAPNLHGNNQTELHFDRNDNIFQQQASKHERTSARVPCIEYSTTPGANQQMFTMDFWALFAMLVGCSLIVAAIARAFMWWYRSRREAARQQVAQQRALDLARDGTEEQLRRQLRRQQQQLMQQEQQEQPIELPPQTHVGGREEVRRDGPAAASLAQS